MTIMVCIVVRLVFMSCSVCKGVWVSPDVCSVSDAC